MDGWLVGGIMIVGLQGVKGFLDKVWENTRL